MPLEKTYQRIDLKKWQRICLAAADQGISIQARTGEASHMGVKLKWAYLEPEKKLVIVIEDSFLIAPEQALELIDGIIKAA